MALAPSPQFQKSENKNKKVVHAKESGNKKIPRISLFNERKKVSTSAPSQRTFPGSPFFRSKAI